MMKFHQIQILAKPRRVFKFLVILVLLLWSGTRYHVDVYVSRMSNYLLNPFVNFVIGNAIVILLLFIYRKNDAGLNSGTNDFQYDYFQITDVPNCQEIHEDEKKQIVADIGGFVNTQSQFQFESIDKTSEFDISADKNVKIVSVFENTVSQVRCDLVTTTKEKVHQFQRTKSELLNSEVHRLQRTKSELLNSEGRERTRGKLRRSESEISSRLVSSFETVDKLSSEEFNHTIEAYIAKHQRFLWAQKMNE